MISADTNGDNTADVTYEYDALGRRVARTQGATAVVYIHAGQQVVCDYTRGANANTTPAFRYVWGDYIDEPILRQTGSSTLLYYHHNQQYSTVALTSDSGLVVTRYGYTAYGDQTILSHTGASQTYATYSNRISYTGRDWDDSLKAHYFRARWYDAALGRFVNRDPLGYVDGTGLYLNNFGLHLLDPFGMTIKKCNCSILAPGGLPLSGSKMVIDNWTIFTAGTCKTSCCAKFVPKPNFSCSGVELPPTANEAKVTTLCNSIPRGRDMDSNGISDFDECEAFIERMMNTVKDTDPGVTYFPWFHGLKRVDKGGYCIPWMYNFRQSFGGFDPNGRINNHFCTIELLEVPTKDEKSYWAPLGSYSGHAIGRICCGPPEYRRCMYFDVGSKGWTGQFGGDDNWFPPDYQPFVEQMDLENAKYFY